MCAFKLVITAFACVAWHMQIFIMQLKFKCRCTPRVPSTHVWQRFMRPCVCVCACACLMYANLKCRKNCASIWRWSAMTCRSVACLVFAVCISFRCNIVVVALWPQFVAITVCSTIGKTFLLNISVQLFFLFLFFLYVLRAFSFFVFQLFAYYYFVLLCTTHFRYLLLVNIPFYCSSDFCIVSRYVCVCICKYICIWIYAYGIFALNPYPHCRNNNKNNNKIKTSL